MIRTNEAKLMLEANIKNFELKKLENVELLIKKVTERGKCVIATHERVNDKITFWDGSALMFKKLGYGVRKYFIGKWNIITISWMNQ